MGDRLLTRAERKAIRFMPCGKCKKRPPYADGSWTQKHRLKPGSKGGQYTVKNTVPRCPRCHATEPGHKKMVLGSGRPKSPETRARMRGHVPWNKGKRGLFHHSAEWREALRKRTISPETRAKIGAAHRGKVISPEHRARISEYAKNRSAETRAKISAALRGKSSRCNHVRWHVKRGISNPDCPFCN